MLHIWLNAKRAWCEIWVLSLPLNHSTVYRQLRYNVNNNRYCETPLQPVMVNKHFHIAKGGIVTTVLIGNFHLFIHLLMGSSWLLDQHPDIENWHGLCMCRWLNAPETSLVINCWECLCGGQRKQKDINHPTPSLFNLLLSSKWYYAA